MSNAAIPPESRRAMFRAVVVATAAGERETGVRRVACAMLGTDSAATMCARAGLPAQSLMDIVDAGFAGLMTRVERELAEAGEQFGSGTHMASLGFDTWPLSESVREALRTYLAVERVVSLTPAHILLALLSADAVLAAQLRDAGLTDDILRDAARAN